MIVGGSWSSAASACSASRPDITGMRMSISTTSGLTCGISSTAWRAVAGLGDDFDALGQLEQGADALAHQGLVVDQADADHAGALQWSSWMSRAKPCPGAGDDIGAAAICGEALAHAAQAVARPGAARRRRRRRGRAMPDHARRRGSTRSHRWRGAGMAHGVGDDFLGAAQQDLRALGVVHAAGGSATSRSMSSAGTPSTSVRRAPPRSMRALVAHLADRLAHVGQQQLGQGVALLDVLLRLALGQVAGDLEVQAERGEVVAQQVVQFARDAQCARSSRELSASRARVARSSAFRRRCSSRACGLLLGAPGR